jgi:sec-independent protein translocase protein TatA
MPFGIQPIHIIIIIVVAFLIFGASRLPEIGRSLGKSITEFKKGTKEAAEGFKEEVGKPGGAPAPQAAAPAVPPPSPYVQTAAPAPAGLPTGNFCIKCGAPNLADARFCNSCGTQLPQKVA